MMVVPKSGREDVPWAERWVVVGRGAEVGDKRKAGDDEASETKRTKLTVSDTSYGSTSRKACTMPTPNPVAQEIINALSNNPETTTAKGDVFLRPDVLESICTCESVRPPSYPYPPVLASLIRADPLCTPVYVAGKRVTIPGSRRTRVPPGTGRSER